MRWNLKAPSEETNEPKARVSAVNVNPKAKHWPDEQKSHMRRSQWVRRHISLKPNTCTETVDVYAAGISVKVTRITLGGLLSCHWLPAS